MPVSTFGRTCSRRLTSSRSPLCTIMCSRQKPAIPAGVSSALGDASAFLGFWKGQGKGVYPTIDSFEYFEELSFTTSGKPFLLMTQKTKNPQTGEPMHTETGYINFRPNGVVTMTACDPTGLAHVYEGRVERDGGGSTTITLETSAVTRVSWAKEVTGVKRVLRVDPEGNSLSYTLDMAAVGQPMQLHLDATLHRVQQPIDWLISVDGARRDQDSVLFLDIREPTEKESVPPIPGCMEVPMDALMKSLGDKLAPDMQNLVEVAAGYGKVVVVCGSGRRAQTVVGRLRKENVSNAYALEGGIHAWHKSNGEEPAT